jgi:hypothetical protein
MSMRGRRTPIDSTKLAAAFGRMRKAGMLARMNFACCSTCGFYELGEKFKAMDATKRAMSPGIAFFHSQDAERLRNGEDLMIAFGSPEDDRIVDAGRVVVACLKAEGLTVEWNETAERRIRVLSPWSLKQYEVEAAQKRLDEAGPDEAFRIASGVE